MMILDDEGYTERRNAARDYILDHIFPDGTSQEWMDRRRINELRKLWRADELESGSR